jgi:polyisoprenoid-binding protein YceI
MTVRAFAGGALSVMGHNPTFAVRDVRGEASLDPDGTAAALSLSIDATTLALTDSVSDSDRREIERTMREEVLETSRFPDIVYDCPESKASVTRNGDGQFQIRLDGDLTLHGVTRSHPITAKVYLMGGMLRGSAESSLRQTDFGIKLVHVAGGMLKVKEEVKLTFDLVARKQD